MQGNPTRVSSQAATKTAGVVTYSVSLPGGVQLTASSGTDQVWSYPNLHGDVILTADKDGVRVGDRQV